MSNDPLKQPQKRKKSVRMRFFYKYKGKKITEVQVGGANLSERKNFTTLKQR
jgi:hypothetical protein